MTIDTNILAQALRQPLPGERAQRLMSPSVRFTGKTPHNADHARESSVMILLFQKEDGWYFPMIKRPEYQGAHSGQVSLPGGKKEHGDESLLYTAIRETEEEIGIDRSQVTFLGELTSLYIPNSNFMVYPQVGLLNGTPTFKANPREVEHIIEAPVAHLANPDAIRSFQRSINNITVKAPFFSFDPFEVWGATAMILSEFIEVIKTHCVNPLLHSYNDCSAPECQ